MYDQYNLVHGMLKQLMIETDYPAYELYTEPFRANLSCMKKLTLVIGRDRELIATL